MDPRLLDYYNSELSFMREMGAEFAKQFSKIAGRLGMQGLEVADPYVERLLEGFAFLTARVQLKLDDEFPRFTQHMLELVYPHYLSPTPSMAVVQLSPNEAEGSLQEGVTVPRGAALRGVLGKDEQTACEYRTAHDTTLWPIAVDDVEYHTFIGNLAGVSRKHREATRAQLTLRLRTFGELSFNELPIDELPIFLSGEMEQVAPLYEQLLGRSIALYARPVDADNPKNALGDWIRCSDGVKSYGFDDEQALLPRTARSFSGYRLLHEYFTFPRRFLFANFTGLQRALPRCDSTAIELMVLLDQAKPALEGDIASERFALYCTPAINLFPRRADRIHLNDVDHEYHVVPDRTRPMDFEVYAVREVAGYGSGADLRRRFRPFYQQSDDDHEDAYYTVRRQQRLLSSRQRSRGARSSYVGSEVFLALVDGDEGPFRSDLRQLAIEVLCTNRDLPLHMPLGQGKTDFTLTSGAPVSEVRCLAGPTAPQPSRAHGKTAWQLISHLSVNHRSLTDVKTLRALLALYRDFGDPTAMRQIEGLRDVKARSVARRVPTAKGLSPFSRGVEITLDADEAGFHGASTYLLGAVLERFFAKYTTINSFTETVLTSVQSGVIKRWPARTGQAQVL